MRICCVCERILSLSACELKEKGMMREGFWAKLDELVAGGR